MRLNFQFEGRLGSETDREQRSAASRLPLEAMVRLGLRETPNARLDRHNSSVATRNAWDQNVRIFVPYSAEVGAAVLSLPWNLARYLWCKDTTDAITSTVFGAGESAKRTFSASFL